MSRTTMNNRMLSRRKLLASVGLGTVFGALAMTRGAFAMSNGTISGSSELGLAYANRCSSIANGEHAQIQDRLQTILASLPGQKGETLSQTAICPICGCPVTVTRTVD